LAKVDWTQFDVVGFACSYSQTNASIALATRLRQTYPNLPLIVGGCACSDTMGIALLRATDVFLAAALGEADEIIVRLVEAAARHDVRALVEIPGVACRIGADVQSGPEKLRVENVDELPTPDYTDYYKYRPNELADMLPFYIPIEASRGCWWGAKSHCTFCGLNPTRMAFHEKGSARFLDEVVELRDRHHPLRFMAVDNIMPHSYYTSVLPSLVECSGCAEFFFEVKANFRRDQMEAFATANVKQIQPGVESLNSRVLRLMRKGTTAVANLYTLRLVQELGLRAHWSILYGFGGEEIADYQLTRQLAVRSMHLPPPMGLFPVEVERFSPMFRAPHDHGLTNIQPSSWYRFCHPVAPEILVDLAYRFDADYVNRPDSLTHDIALLLNNVVSEWQDRHAANTCQLFVREDLPGRLCVLRVIDNVTKVYRLDETTAAIYRAFSRPRRVQTVVPDLHRPDGYEPYLDEDLLEQARCELHSPERAVNLRADKPADAYGLLLVHGLVAEEEGMAVALACGIKPAEGTDSLTIDDLRVPATRYLALATR
jgi:ribosomal peptide maturation radical SAM protein 1